MRKIVMATMLLGLGLGPVFAQVVPPATETKPAGEELSTADCQRNFRIADANGDGTLSLDEQESAENAIPTGLALSGPITEAEFMTLCTQNIPKGG